MMTKEGIISNMKSFWAKYEKWAYVVFYAILIVFSLVCQDVYFFAVAINCLIFTVLAFSLNLLTGYLGVTSLGHAAFFGIGAYTTAILQTTYNTNQWLVLILAIAITALAGALLSLTTMRVSSKFVAVVTLGFAEIVRMVELNWMELTRGPQGIPNIPKFTFFGQEIRNMRFELYIIMVISIVILLFYSALLSSKHGRAIQAIKNDEIAAQSMGINALKYRVLVFAISAGTAGLAGCFYAKYMGFIDPNAFNFDQSISMLSMTLFGGLGNLMGSIIGAFFLSILPEALRFMSDYRQVIYGILLVIMMIFRPNGLLGGINFKQIRLLDRQKMEEE